MIDEQTTAEILRLHFAEGFKIGTIAKQLAIHHSVVRRVIEKRPRKTAERGRELDGFLPFIEEQLGKYPGIAARRLFEMVEHRGYRGGPDHFRHLISQLRPSPAPEAFLRLSKLPAEEGQVDWGHFGSMEIGGAKRRIVAFVMVLSYSRAIFLRFFHDEKMASFLRGHQEAFDFFGGVPRKLLYDNLKSAVVTRVGATIQFNEQLLQFSGQCLFQPRAAGVRKGNEKGRVERAIRFVRTSFWPAREFKDLLDLNKQAMEWIQGRSLRRQWPQDKARTVGDALIEEQKRLLPVPDIAPVEVIVDVKSAKTPYVRFDRNDYSVPCKYVQRQLIVRATDREVRILDGSDVIGHHRRSYGAGESIEDPDHIAELKRRKAKAREGAAQHSIVARVPVCRELFLQLADHRLSIGAAVKHLSRLIALYDRAEIDQAVREAIACGSPHPNSVQHILERRSKEKDDRPILPVRLEDGSKGKGINVQMTDFRDFDRLAASAGDSTEQEDI